LRMNRSSPASRVTSVVQYPHTPILRKNIPHSTTIFKDPLSSSQACRAIGSWAGFSLVRVRLWVESQATCSLAFTLERLPSLGCLSTTTYLITLFSSTTFYQSTTPHLASHRRAHSTRAQRIATAPHGDPQAAHGKQVGI
jgi:hypothetical protein